MSDFTCPACDYPNPNYDKVYGFYNCPACKESWGFDEDDPDYDDAFSLYCCDENICAKCSGSGLIQEDGELYRCPKCDGSGSV